MCQDCFVFLFLVSSGKFSSTALTDCNPGLGLSSMLGCSVSPADSNTVSRAFGPLMDFPFVFGTHCFCSAHAQIPRPSLCSEISSTAFTCSPAITASPWKNQMRSLRSVSRPHLFTCLPSSLSFPFVTINLLPQFWSSCLCFLVGELQNITLSRTLHLVEGLSCPQVIRVDHGISVSVTLWPLLLITTNSTLKRLKKLEVSKKGCKTL